MCRIATCLLVVILAAGCDGYRQADGQVIDAADKPVVDASVRLLKAGDDPSRASEAKTDKQGRYSVGRVGSPTGKVRFNLTVSKAGFKTHSEVIELSSGSPQETKIVLDGDGKE